MSETRTTDCVNLVDESEPSTAVEETELIQTNLIDLRPTCLELRHSSTNDRKIHLIAKFPTQNSLLSMLLTTLPSWYMLRRFAEKLVTPTSSHEIIRLSHRREPNRTYSP